MRPKFLTDRAILIEPDRILVLSDLHLGIEKELAENGITIPSQVEKLKERIKKMIKENKIKHLIILGDIKHEVKGISYLEYREVPQFFKDLKIKISLIKGNHDGNIEKLLPKEIDIYDGKGFSIKNFTFTHGHAWPNPDALDSEYIIMGHMHPAVEFWTKEFRTVEHCWVKCEVNKKKLEKKYKKKSKLKYGIIMPTFNHLTGGLAFNSKEFRPKGLAPKILKWKEGAVYLLDGTFLGKLNEITK